MILFYTLNIINPWQDKYQVSTKQCLSLPLLKSLIGNDGCCAAGYTYLYDGKYTPIRLPHDFGLSPPTENYIFNKRVESAGVVNN